MADSSVYSGGLDANSTAHTDNVSEPVDADDINLIASGVNKIQATLGTSPHGTLGNVRLRFEQIQNATRVYSVSGHVTDRSFVKPARTVTNLVVDRILDCDGEILGSLADVLGTLMNDVTELENLVCTLIVDAGPTGSKIVG